MRVLLVEDDRMIAQVLQIRAAPGRLCRGLDADGESTADALRSSAFDLARLDIGLPGRDWLDVLREMRAMAIPRW